jgi:hypothetical protein
MNSYTYSTIFQRLKLLTGCKSALNGLVEHWFSYRSGRVSGLSGTCKPLRENKNKQSSEALKLQAGEEADFIFN